MSFSISAKRYRQPIFSFVVILALCLTCSGLFSARAFGSEEGAKMMLLRVKPAVVFIVSKISGQVQIKTKSGPRNFNDVGAVSSGSGFIINPNGYICTNGHVVQYYYEKNDQQIERLFLLQVLKKHFLPRLIQSGEIQNDPVSIKKAMVELYGLMKPKTTVKIKKDLVVFLSNKKRYPAEVKDYSPPMGAYPGKLDIPGFQYESETGKDIALIKIEAKDLPAVVLGDSGAVQLGEQVYAAGYPGVVLQHAMLQKSLANFLDCTVTVGHISGKKLTATGASLLQTDTAITHGNSGGPDFNARGEVVGMSTLGSNTKTQSGTQQIQGFNFLVPINTVKEFIARAGIKTGIPSLFNTMWIKALNAYKAQECDEVMDHCSAALKLMPNQPDVLKLQRLTQERITRGECPLSKKKIILYAGGALVIIIIVVILIIVLTKKRGQKEPAASPKPAPSKVSGVTMVEKSEPTPAALGRLEGKDGPIAGKTFEIPAEGLKIGRDAIRCDISIDNPHVSREHAWVGEEDGNIILKDLASANGTFVNSLSHQVTSQVLKPGDVIIIGKGKMASLVYKKA